MRPLASLAGNTTAGRGNSLPLNTSYRRCRLIHISNKARGGEGIPVDRGTALGNPFSWKEGTRAKYLVKDREESIRAYGPWLEEQIKARDPAIIAALTELMVAARQGDITLQCWCAPLSCHAEKIREVLERALAREREQVPQAAAPALVYTGVGSRETPPEILAWMAKIGAWMARQGFILRSGAAGGADRAFETGCDREHGLKEIYLPWTGFNGHSSQLCTVGEGALKLAAEMHPAWGRCSQGARKLHARNGYQVLGADLRTPSNMLVCWTPGGAGGGGTGQAIRIARKHAIPVFDLAVDGEVHRLRAFADQLLARAGEAKAA